MGIQLLQPIAEAIKSVLPNNSNTSSRARRFFIIGVCMDTKLSPLPFIAHWIGLNVEKYSSDTGRVNNVADGRNPVIAIGNRTQPALFPKPLFRLAVWRATAGEIIYDTATRSSS